MLSLGKQARKSKRSGVLATIGGSVLALLLFFASSPTSYAADATNGAALFKNNCASCHNAKMEKDLTGPGLYGVMDRIPSEEGWIYEWVRNSSKVINAGDPYASALYEKWNKTQMTAMEHLTNEDIDDIMAYIVAYEPPTAVADAGGSLPDISEDESLVGLMGWVRILVLIIVLLLGGIAMQLARLRGIDFFSWVNWDKANSYLMLAFGTLGLGGMAISTYLYRHVFLFKDAASVHGAEIDQLFWITMTIVFGVFLITNFLLFFFAFRYANDGKRKATYYPENHKLELIWTVVPAVVLATLVIFGIRVWSRTMMKPASENAEQIELNAQQFGWNIRYPGVNKKFAKLDRHLISGDNSLGIDFYTDDAKDDFLSSDLVLPLGREVVLNIRSRDVLHSAYLPHFRVKMDAVPGMPTKFKFTPTISTDSMRVIRDDPEFDYELACTEVCGRGHFSMRKRVVVVSQDSFDTWVSKQPVYYKASLHEQNIPIGNSNGIAENRSVSTEK